MTELEKALALLGIGAYVFPVNPANKIGYTPRGHLDASNDPEQVATWFGGEFPDAVVGVHAGPSELVFLDLDIRPDKGVNGFHSLGFLEIPKTFNYTTKSGGSHFVYELSDAIPPANRYRGMAGVDRKSGSSYCVWAGDVPATREEFAMPPTWLLDLPEDNTNATAFSGSLDEWLSTIPQGKMTAKVKDLVDNLPTTDFGHQDILNITYRLVRMAAEGHTGVGDALDIVWKTWVKPPYDTPEYKKELQNAIAGAVKRAGEEDESIKNLPEYGEVLDKVSIDLLRLLTAESSDKAGYFKAIKAVVLEGFTLDEAAALIWSAPGTKEFARDWGIEYLFEQIGKVSLDLPTPGFDIELSTVPEPTTVELLSNQERLSIANSSTFIDSYIDHAGTLVPKQNKPYDWMNAWMVISAAYADFGFTPRKNGPEPCNFYSMTLGETTTGKSAARKFKLSVLYEIFWDDEEFNIGGSPSPNGLSRKLVERDRKVSYYNKDEAHGNLKVWGGKGGGGEWTTGILEDFAEMYDGKVTGSLRAKAQDGEGKTAQTYFLMDLMGTPKAMIGALHRDMFLTGFLARFQWAVGEPREVSYDSMAEEDSDGDEVRHGFNPGARQLAAQLVGAKSLIKREFNTPRVPVGITQAAATRLQDAKWQLNQTFENTDNWEILDPSLVRMGVTIRKAAALIALSEARTRVTLRDILVALESAEQWVMNLVIVAGQISDSDFGRDSENMWNYIAGRPSGEVSVIEFNRKFSSIEPFIVNRHLDALRGQQRLRDFKGPNKQMWLAVIR